jgi:hypothetical protein
MPVLDVVGFRALIASLTNLSDGATSWATDPQDFVSDTDRAKVSLDLFSMEALAVDEHRRCYDAPGQPANSFTTLEIGNRTLVVTIRAESFDSGAQAAELLDQIRTGIRAEAVTEQLNALLLAFVWAEKATRVQYKIDNRVVNCAIADFTFAGIAQQVSSVYIDGSGTTGGYISTVNTTNIVPGTLTP